MQPFALSQGHEGFSPSPLIGFEYYFTDFTKGIHITHDLSFTQFRGGLPEKIAPMISPFGIAL
jgi:hypothetical protein